MGLSGIWGICLWGADSTYSHNLPGAEIRSRAPAAQCHLLCSETQCGVSVSGVVAASCLSSRIQTDYRFSPKN